MTRLMQAALIIGLLLFVVECVADVRLVEQAQRGLIPLCQEDEVIVGTGDYVGGRGWDGYVCIPADDL